MKKLLITSLILIITLPALMGQNINWRTTDSTNNMAYLNFGYDFGVTLQGGYGLKLGKQKPIFLSADIAAPMGRNLTDELKTRIGGQIEVYHKNRFSVTALAFANFRKHRTELVRMLSFGSELSLVAGHYRPSWFIAGELGFDKAIVTHLKHSEVQLDFYPDTFNGWLKPAGGHIFCGITGGKKLGKHMELNLRVGINNAQSDDRDPLLPFYFQLGLAKSF